MESEIGDGYRINHEMANEGVVLTIFSIFRNFNCIVQNYDIFRYNYIF